MRLYDDNYVQIQIYGHLDIPLIFAENKRSVKNVKNGIDVWADFGVK